MLIDILLLLGIILPIVAGIAIKVLCIPASSGISITGAHVFFTVDLPFGGMPITEAQVNSWLVITSIFFLCLYLTRNMNTRKQSRRQIIAEWIVEKTDNLVRSNMGKNFMGFVPFIAAMLALSAFSSLLSLVGLFAPTSDLNVVAGWAILVFILITYYKMKCGPLHYLKSFCEPVPFLAPLNLISEIATPVSMSLRHYGNILSGSVISVILASGLTVLSEKLLGSIGDFPFFRVGIPGVLSVYFDVFSGCLQAFIFAMLTMVYVSGAFAEDDYNRRKQKKQAKETL
ncbi:MAG: F0F1 ATP synthase subunit A [Clostridiales bacterium]|nr:F0F1 ATP synthase subunit A [Clostridiales bacterium]